MTVHIKKWGNSASVRIPSALMAAVHLQLNDRVELRVDAGRIVIEPVRHHYRLDALLADITPKNKHGSVDFGDSVGEEFF